MVRMKKSYWIIAGVLLIALVVGVINQRQISAQETKFFTQTNVYDTNIPKSWETFKNEQKFPDNTRLIGFAMTLDNEGNFASVKFSLAEKKGKKYSIYNYDGCIDCPDLKDNEISVWKEKVSDLPKYSKLMVADDFFKKLQDLNDLKALSEDKVNTLFLVRTRLWNEDIKYPGKYFRLEEGQIQPIEAPNDQLSYEGITIQILENQLKKFQSDDNTKNIIIAE